jgi:hypothetical protein
MRSRGPDRATAWGERGTRGFAPEGGPGPCRRSRARRADSRGDRTPTAARPDSDRPPCARALPTWRAPSPAGDPERRDKPGIPSESVQRHSPERPGSSPSASLSAPRAAAAPRRHARPRARARAGADQDRIRMHWRPARHDPGPPPPPDSGTDSEAGRASLGPGAAIMASHRLGGSPPQRPSATRSPPPARHSAELPPRRPRPSNGRGLGGGARQVPPCLLRDGSSRPAVGAHSDSDDS